MQPRRLIALLSLLFVFNTMISGTLYSLSNMDSPAAVKTLLDADSLPEEEDDENSDLNLKFLPPDCGAHLPKFLFSYRKSSDNSDYGFISEILTPPPLT